MAAPFRHKAKSRLRNAVARYRDARRSLHAPASWRSRYGLDWTNFFIADVQTGFGTFVAFYLAHLGWSHSSIGLALQLSFCLKVGALSGSLVSPSPEGPCDDMCRLNPLSGESDGDAADFLD